jgi:hypothetical protein
MTAHRLCVCPLDSNPLAVTIEWPPILLERRQLPQTSYGRPSLPIFQKRFGHFGVRYRRTSRNKLASNNGMCPQPHSTPLSGTAPSILSSSRRVRAF